MHPPVAFMDEPEDILHLIFLPSVLSSEGGSMIGLELYAYGTVEDFEQIGYTDVLLLRFNGFRPEYIREGLLEHARSS